MHIFAASLCSLTQTHIMFITFLKGLYFLAATRLAFQKDIRGSKIKKPALKIEMLLRYELNLYYEKNGSLLHQYVNFFSIFCNIIMKVAFKMSVIM